MPDEARSAKLKRNVRTLSACVNRESYESRPINIAAAVINIHGSLVATRDHREVLYFTACVVCPARQSFTAPLNIKYLRLTTTSHN